MELMVWFDHFATQAAFLTGLGGLVLTSLAIVRDIEKRRARVAAGVPAD